LIVIFHYSSTVNSPQSYKNGAFTIKNCAIELRKYMRGESFLLNKKLSYSHWINYICITKLNSKIQTTLKNRDVIWKEHGVGLARRIKSPLPC
jgi:hypothetical protein